MSKRQLAGAFFVDKGLNPNRCRINQGEDWITGLDHRARLDVASHDNRIIGCDQPVMGEQCLFQLQGGRRICALRADHGQIGFGQGQFGPRHILVALCLLGSLDRGDVLPRKFLLSIVRGDALRQNCLRPRHCGIGLGLTGGICRNRCLRPRNARYLLSRMQGGQFLSGLDRIPCICRHRHQCRANFEPDARQDPGLDGT